MRFSCGVKPFHRVESSLHLDGTFLEDLTLPEILPAFG